MSTSGPEGAEPSGRLLKATIESVFAFTVRAVRPATDMTRCRCIRIGFLVLGRAPMMVTEGALLARHAQDMTR
jgi:hypothetical protein